MNNRNRDFRPNRRRSFDDDNYEPPRRNFGFAPPSGPQFETPTGPSIRGTVKWYNPEKGFGFVQLADGSGDAFLHVSVAELSGHSSVPPGATLEVRTSPGPKGPQVTEIISVDASTASREPPRRPRPERPAYPSGDRGAVEELGTDDGTTPIRASALSLRIRAERISSCTPRRWNVPASWAWRKGSVSPST